MSKEILAMVESFSNEKAISKDIVFDAIEASLQYVTIKHYKDDNIKVIINKKTGEYDTYNLDAKIDSIEIGRIGVQYAKQIINQKMKDAYNRKIYNDYKHKEGSILSGTIKRIDKGGNVYLDIGNEILVYLPKSEIIPRESIKYGNKLSVYLKEVKEDNNTLYGSRVCHEFLNALLHKEINDIINGKISVVNVARDAGARSKVSVKCNLKNFDAIGAIIGMKGSRLQPIINELAGERIDIIKWDANDAQYVVNALAPAEIQSIIIDEDKHSMEISVDNKNISKAIGKSGQNVRLASILTGWEINVIDADEQDKDKLLQSELLSKTFMEYLDIDAESAQSLISVGFTTIEEIAYVPSNEMFDAGFDYDYIDELKNRAKDALLLLELSKEESNELEYLEGMTAEFLMDLNNNRVLSIQDLADLSVYDVEEFCTLSSSYVGDMIMKARAII